MVEFDKLVKKIYKPFSKPPKKLLDLQKWSVLKELKYHKLLNIFDITCLSRFNSVNNLRLNIAALLDILRDTKSSVKETKKMGAKASKIYDMATSYENLFLLNVISDVLVLCSQITVAFQNDNYYLYKILDTVLDLNKNLTDAYLMNPDLIAGIYYMEFKKM